MKKIKKNKKGFTLVEMLVVVAIISVLAAVLIPVVSNSLTKSKEAADIANLRSAYAKYEIEVLTGEVSEEDTASLDAFIAKYIPGAKLNYEDKASLQNMELIYNGNTVMAWKLTDNLD